MMSVRPQGEKSAAVHAAAKSNRFTRVVATLGALVLLGVASNAGALQITGSGTSVPGGGSCTISPAIPSTGTGAVATCTGINLAAHTKVYLGINNVSVPSHNGLTMTGTAPASGSAAIYRSSSTTASSITYTSTTTVTSHANFGFGTDTVSNVLLLSRSAGTGSPVATGGTPANNGSGDIGHLFQVTSASFTLDIDATSTHPDFGSGQSCGRYDAAHPTAANGGCISGVNIKFYWSDCGDGVIDSPEVCDDGGSNGTLGSCCTTSCTFKTAGTQCTDSSPTNCKDAQCTGVANVCDQNFANESNGSSCAGNGTGECTAADTCSAGVCLNNDTAATTPCTDITPTSGGDCKDAQCNGTGACDQNFGNETAGTGCMDGDFCNGSDQCNGSGTCSIHAGDPCDGPGDADSDCSETCVDTGYEVGNCNGQDTNGSSCTDGQFCTGTESCTGGVCGSSTGDPCPGADGDADCQESCNEVGDNCLANDPNGSSCTGNGTGDCTAADTCQAGACEDNDHAAGTPCTDTSPPSSGDCNDAQCDGNNVCDQNFADEADGTACDNGFFCDGTETCTTGTCTNSTGDPCPGPDMDTNCAESCDEGANNCLANDLDGTTCRPDAGECDVEEQCSSGSCPADGFEANGFPCGSPADTDCSNADSCDGAGVCDPRNEVSGFACGDPSDTDCTDADTCDGSGSCEDNHEPGPGTVVCRPATTGGLCDEIEYCDGAGSCPADGVKASGVTCRADTGDCDLEEECDGVSHFCDPDAFEPALTPCGDPFNSDCDNPDTCDGNNNCLDNLEANGFACGDPSNTDCTNPDTCDGAGTCEDNHEANGFACGDPLDDDCTNPDTCDGGGSCQDNHEANGFACGDPLNDDCTNPDTCDGGGTCEDNHETAGTGCGDPTDDDCTDPDTCDGAGTCDGNHEPGPGTVLCRAATSGADCNEPEFCDGAGSCPPDTLFPSGTICRATTTVETCDEAEVCDGVSVFCPADGVKDAGEICRPASGDCDVAETCSGTNDICPGDGFANSGDPCGNPSDTDCTDPDTCDGNNVCESNDEMDGDPCTDDGLFCTGLESCQSGVCTGDGDPCMGGESCAEPNLCIPGSCGLAPKPFGTCLTAGKSIFIYKDKTPDSSDGVAYKWIKGAATVPGDFADPVNSANYSLCVYASGVTGAVIEAEVPPGMGKWTGTSKGYKYKDPQLTQDGTKKVLAKSGANTKSKVLWKGKGANLDDVPAGTLPIDGNMTGTPADFPITVQVTNSEGVCVESVFEADKVKKNTNKLLKLKE